MHPMTLEQLRIFIVVAQQEHFTRGAERLGLSQSSVSGAIAALESHFKVSLFDRSRRHVSLTNAGNVLLTEAEDILGRVDLVERRMQDLAELRSGSVSLAASQTVGSYWLPPILNRFCEQYPGITIDLWTGNSTQAEKRVLAGRADLAIIEQEPLDSSLNAELVSTDMLVLVVGPLHPWYGRDAIDWSELTNTTWIMREPGSGTRALFEAELVAHGIPPAALNTTLTLRSGEAVRSAVSMSRSAAVISSLVAQVAIDAGLLRRLEPLALPRNYYALSSKTAPPTRALDVLLNDIRAGMSAEFLARSSSPIVLTDQQGLQLR
jgi:DNA-binding transcriptional LysR family regulator